MTPQLRRSARAGERLADARHGLAGGLRSAARGGVLTWRAAGGRCAAGLSRALHGEPGGIAVVAAAVGRALVQAPADALLMLGGRVLSAVQTLAGVEPPGRALAAEELALLRPVFGDGLDYRRIRLKEGELGLFGLPRRAFVHGDTIFVPAGRVVEPAPGRAALLVHEAVHVWQHQRRGTAYMSEALAAQWLGDGYNFAIGLAAGRRWRELNPEQQAEMVEQAFAAGALAPGRACRFLVALTDPRRDHGFAVEVVDDGDVSALEAAVGRGFVDRTAELAEALVELRSEA